MPIITPSFTTALAAPVASDATVIRVAPNQADLCETVTTGGKHVVLTIFNAKYSELVLATGCEVVEGIQHVTVQRGFGGTTARDWALSSCVCTASIMDACDTASDPDSCPKPLAGVKTEGCLEIIDGDTCTPTIRLKPTSVTPITNDCIRINACGLVEWVSPNFPWDCMPVYEPCSPCAACGGGGGGGGTTAVAASAVSFSGSGNLFALGPDVGSALNQLDLAVQAIATAGGVMSVTEGDGITISGTAQNPVVSMTPVAVPGDYGAFTINEFGQIISYDDSIVESSHVGELPISVAYNSATGVFTYSIATASEVAPGAVQLVADADVQAGTVPPSSDLFAVSWRALLTFFQNWMPELNTGGGIAGSAGIFNTARTLVLNFLGLPAADTVDDTDYFAYTTPAGVHGRILVADAARELGGVYASAVVNMPSASVVASKGVSGVVRSATGVYTVTMASAGLLPSIYIVNAIGVNYNTRHHYTYQPLSATQFELRFFNAGGAAVDPPQIAFTVTAAG